ncbi:hypothetical protein [Allosphingosinicella deserti]|nr:hypothetical protein [Sphingomonas deserti]
MIRSIVSALAAVSVAAGPTAAVAQNQHPATAPDSATAAAAPASAADAVAPQLLVATPRAPTDRPGALLVPRETMVRLMVLNEVNTHKAKAGERFALRVDEAVALNGVTIIPVGAKAFGEVTEIRENGAVGKAGQIGARLLYAEVGGQRIALTGEDGSKGIKGGDRVALAMLGFGVLGLFARGSQGKLKAGHIFNGYLADDLLYDPAAAAFIEPERAAPVVTVAASPAQP